ncbi:hypothetical protein NDU88_005144 [Pleurodeles waltl]|uniref:Uncharacterized protein n=1 Tax=Pleurodeles waltl TaxID=8319 RepID=A0AAV7NQN6_PLEWA|nr:hypothetical protein NDU88_005144 [Pleurodeles waltl]
MKQGVAPPSTEGRGGNGWGPGGMELHMNLRRKSVVNHVVDDIVEAGINCWGCRVAFSIVSVIPVGWVVVASVVIDGTVVDIAVINDTFIDSNHGVIINGVFIDSEILIDWIEAEAEIEGVIDVAVVGAAIVEVTKLTVDTVLADVVLEGEVITDKSCFFVDGFNEDLGGWAPVFMDGVLISVSL